MLDLCEDLQRLRTRMSDPQLGRDERSRLRRETTRKVHLLSRNLSRYRFRGPIARMIGEQRFTPPEFEVLSVLLQRTMRADEPEIQGRLILGTIFDSASGVLSGMHLLQENARLRSSGLVTVADDQAPGADVLETRFRLSEDAIDSLRSEVEPARPGTLRPQRRSRTYARHRELLLDLRILHNLYQARSARVFEGPHWERMQGAGGLVGRALGRRIERGWARVRGRLSRTPIAGDFPIIRLIRAHGLQDEEVIIVVHLLFRELYEGNAHADTVELMRLVSDSEEDLLRSRRLFAKGSTLVGHEVVAIEPLLEGREMTGEAHLNDWVVNDLLGIEPQEDAIRAEERLDWHLYLRNLEDSAGFFRDLQS